MILTKTVMVGIGGKNCKHYSDLGYKNLRHGEKIEVPIDELTVGSNVKISVRCDYCGKIFEKTFKSYNRERSNVIQKDSCMSCAHKKARESNLIVYGETNVMHVPEIKSKQETTILKKFGTKNVSTLDWVKKKVSDKWNKKSKSERGAIREKIVKTNIEKYGVSCPLVLPENRKKLFDTLQKGSSQQRKTFNIISGMGFDFVEYNYSYSNLSLDIYVEHDGIMVDVEYDSSYWHNPQMDRRRDEFLKKQGLRIIRIKSGKRVPNEKEIENAFDKILEENYLYREIFLSDWDENLYEQGGR